MLSNAILIIRISGICLGFQAAVIEFARNKLNKKNAHSMESAETRDTLLPEEAVVSKPSHIFYTHSRTQYLLSGVTFV